MNKTIPKVIAIYLPQFHETDDNNLWWGKGFTDWESVKNSEKYFEGHEAPWTPLEENYYDLSKYETMKLQAEMAKKYGIGGFCFYHYYFEKGKMELELPAENLLKWQDIDMPFCFNWASASWIKSWSKISGDIWNEKYEKGEDDVSNGILVRQDYGNEADWQKHFEYLLPFFKDERYIRIDNKPVFIFYRPNEVKQLNSMVELWRKLATKAGLEGLYLIGVNTNISDIELDAAMLYEPRTSINNLNDQGKAFINNGVRCFEYSDIWDSIINCKPYAGCKTFYTGITGYDDTPRRGKSGECIVHNTPEIFKDGLIRLLKKSVQAGNELVFINAWNEWGEGMYLEPDEKHKFSYLESASDAIKLISEQIDTIELIKEDVRNSTEITILKKDIKKYKSFTELLIKWLEIERYRKFDFTGYFEKQGVKSVAIYGMGMLGKQLYQQLKDEQIELQYGIDRFFGQYGVNFKIIRPEEDFPSVDAIIVTTFDNEQIIKMINNKSKAKVFVIDELIEHFWRDVYE